MDEFSIWHNDVDAVDLHDLDSYGGDQSPILADSQCEVYSGWWPPR